MSLLGKVLGYDKKFADYEHTLRGAKQAIHDMSVERDNLLRTNTRIGRLCAQILKLGAKPVE